MIDYKSYDIIKDYIEKGRIDLVKEHLEQAKDEYYEFEAKQAIEELLKKASGKTKVFQYIKDENGNLKLLFCNTYMIVLMDPLLIIPENGRNLGLINLDNVNQTKNGMKELKTNLYSRFKRWECLCNREIDEVIEPTFEMGNVVKVRAKDSDKLLSFNKKLVDAARIILNQNEIIDQKLSIEECDPILLITSKRGKGLVLGLKDGKNNQ
jgi:hypothetical protein